MANTFTQLYIQVVFAVKGRQNLIQENYKEELHKYITGIIQKRRHKLLAINCMPDHIHIFIGYHPDQSLPYLMRDVKADSSKFINKKGWLNCTFEWQRGYGAFSYSRSQIPAVVRYINNQVQHHRKSDFRTEYIKFLDKFDIPYEEKYLFDWED